MAGPGPAADVGSVLGVRLARPSYPCFPRRRSSSQAGTCPALSAHATRALCSLRGGLYVSTAGRPANALPSRGRRLVASLRKDDPHLPDQIPAYAAEATDMLLQTIARSNGTRPSVTRALFDSRDRDGYVGPVSFDDNGDPRPAAIAIYRVDPKLPRDPRRVVQGLELVRVVEPRPDS
jgi:ABC-type branched-subunit amino acid transport system substrate-binding protein